MRILFIFETNYLHGMAYNKKGERIVRMKKDTTGQRKFVVGSSSRSYRQVKLLHPATGPAILIVCSSRWDAERHAWDYLTQDWYFLERFAAQVGSLLFSPFTNILINCGMIIACPIPRGEIVGLGMGKNFPINPTAKYQLSSSIQVHLSRGRTGNVQVNPATSISCVVGTSA